MQKGRKPAAQTVQELRELRQKAEERLLKLPHVVGSMIGAKIKSGKLTKKLVLTILVDQKVHPDHLGPKERIPRRITIDGQLIHTDVIEARPTILHSAHFHNPLHIRVGKSGFGTVSSFCSSSNSFYGITCAHVLGIEENEGVPHSEVKIQDRTGAWISVGKIDYACRRPGSGTTDDYGCADAALFTLENPELVNLAQSASVISAVKPELREQVQGIGCSSGIRRKGEVQGFECQTDNGKLWDIRIINIDGDGVSGGDSGMLWKNPKGEPVAIHVAGEGDSGLFSKVSYGMLATRAARLLDVDFLDAP